MHIQSPTSRRPRVSVGVPHRPPPASFELNRNTPESISCNPAINAIRITSESEMPFRCATALALSFTGTGILTFTISVLQFCMTAAMYNNALHPVNNYFQLFSCMFFDACFTL
jgi:hypothetical protein